MPPKKAKVMLDDKPVEFKEGALRQQLKVGKDYKFTKAVLNRLKKMPTGTKFTFLGKDFKMTPLLKRRVNFALVLMSKK